MEQMNLRQSDIAPLFGGKTRISEVLNGKRPLNLKIIALLHEYLGIPLESLINSEKEIKLEPNIRQKLLNVPSISKFIGTDAKAV
jgi:HTH-type transcriptional regulator/antitoxin HigA